MATNWDKIAQDLANEKDPDKRKKILEEAFDEANKEKKKKASGKSTPLFDSVDVIKYNQHLMNTAKILGDVTGKREAEQAILIEQIQAQLQLADATKSAEEHRAAAIEMIEEQGDAINRSLDAEGNKKLAMAKQNALIAKGQKKYGQEQKAYLKDVASSIGINMSYQDSFLGKSASMLSMMTQVGDEGKAARGAMADNIKEQFSWQNIALSTFTKIFEMTAMLVKDFDKARAGVAAATGAGYEYEDSMFAAQRATNLYGVSMENVEAATKTLANETANFAKFSDATRASMVQTTAMLEKVGVDGATAAETFQFLNLNLGLTAVEAGKLQKELAMMGTKIGISSAKMTKEFNASLKTLAVYGPKSVKVFSNLASAAKASGVETSKLLGVVKQFDTFSGAAEGVGKLNALLGTQLSTTQMMMMTEDERLETLIGSVQAQGVAFKDMDKFTQMAIASAAGIDDMNEAQKIFGMNLGDYKKNQDEMAKNEAVQEKFNDAIAKTVPIMLKFKLLATEAITAVQPILEGLSVAAEFLTKVLQKMSPTGKALTVGIIALVSGGALLLLTIAPLITAFMSLTPAMAATGPAGVTAAGGITAIGTALTGVISAISAAVAGTVGIGGLVLAAIVGGTIAAVTAFAAVSYAVAEIADSYARVAEAESRSEEAKTKMVVSTVALAATTSQVLTNLQSIAASDFSAATKGMSSLIAKVNEFSELSPKVTATIENLALLSVGTAKNSMTNNIIATNKSDITANIQNVFKNMTLVVDIGGEKFDGKIKKIATETATQIAAGTE